MPRREPSRTRRSTCTSSQTLNAAIQGFAEAGSDGIVQVSWGGAQYLSGQAHKDMVVGAVALAEFAHVVAAQYDVHIALHTDHCPEPQLDGFMRPLIAHLAGARGAAADPAVPVAHVGRLGRAARPQHRDRAGTARGVPQGRTS